MLVIDSSRVLNDLHLVGCQQRVAKTMQYSLFYIDAFPVLLSRLIDRIFTYLLNINITKTCTEGMKSSDDKEFRMFKLKLA